VLGLIADDLTGAGDASVQFAKRGWRTFVSWGLSPVPVLGPEPDVIAITTDSRALPNHVAEQRTADAVTALMQSGIDRVFLKIDSTMRGSVQGQVAGALSAWRTRHPDARAIVCPAYPRMGRTVESNRVLVNGEPVDRTVFGRDPVTPVHTSDIRMLLPDSADVRVADAATDADLMHVAALISTGGPSVLPVGSGGLAEALAATWVDRTTAGTASTIRDILINRKTSRILLQISSLNPVSQSQVARLKAAFPDVVVLDTPLERGDSAAVAANLAMAFAKEIERGEWGILGLIGGDGARETLPRLGASGIRIVDSLIEGVPLGVVAGGKADGVPVFTKAGGFGREDALIRCVERIRRDS
jgi:D-threonate/D-erythronate kinase